MKQKISGMMGAENVSDNSLDIEAYSYGASDLEQKPLMIVWPQSPNQIRRFMVYMNQSHTSVTIRGSGTSTVGGSIGEDHIILCSEKMNKITGIDIEKKTVEVESGVKLEDLNKALSEFNMIFPINPFNKANTVGGLVALDAKSKESHQLNPISDWVEEVEFIDGTGKYYLSKKSEMVVGSEGISGFITKVKLKIIEQPVLSIDIFKHDKILDLLNQVRGLKKDKEIYFLEFFDKNISEELGYGKNFLLIVAYTCMKGKKQSLLDVREILQKISSVHSMLRLKGYYVLQDPMVTLEKTYDLIEWCEKNNVALHGHIGIGLFYAYLLREDQDLLITFRSFVRRINGWLGKSFGYGSLNKSFITPPKKKEFIMLKDNYDYNNILATEKMIAYR